MPFDIFTTVVDKATAFGFETFNLTPLVGEPLADPGFLDKLAYLEHHPGVYDFYFCTNLTLANTDVFLFLEHLDKLRCLSISLYGHDQASFMALTESSPHVYRRLLESLGGLGAYEQLTSKTELRIRTSESFQLETCDSAMCTIVRELSQLGVRVRIPKKYQNWGGLIDTSAASPLADLGIPLKEPDNIKSAPCVFLFFKHTVLPNGDLNACSAGDGNATLTIGNVVAQRFQEIYSTDNARYMQMLDAHRRHEFSGPCQACTGYRSVSTDWYSYKYHHKPFITLDNFYQWLVQNGKGSRP
jgi:hypothetical protein